MKTLVIYLHGFLSSDQAYKASQCLQYINTHKLDVDFLCPQIPDLPSDAVPFLELLITRYLDEKTHKIILVGSSLGGFYATWLAECYNLKACLINPVVCAHERMQAYDETVVGELINPYTCNRFRLNHDQRDILQRVYQPNIKQPHRFYVLLQMADEVLDAGEASKCFSASVCRIEPQGDHQYQGFERYLPELFTWLR